MPVCIVDTLSNYLTLYFYSHTVQVRHKSCALELLLPSVSSKKASNNPAPKNNMILLQLFQPMGLARELCALKTRLGGLTGSKFEFIQHELSRRYKVPERAVSLIKQERATLSSTPNWHLPSTATSIDWFPKGRSPCQLPGSCQMVQWILLLLGKNGGLAL